MKYCAIFSLILAVLVAFVVPVRAQERTNALQLCMGAGGISLPEVDALNERLEANGYENFSVNQLLTGGHARLFIGHFIIGGESYGFSTGTKRTAGYEYLLKGGYSIIEAGYVALSAGNLRVYPLVGLGRGSITLTMYERNSQDFGNVLFNPGRGSVLSRGYLLVSVSVAAEYFFRLIESGGIVLGVQAGYNRAIGTGDWTMFQDGRGTGSDAENGPDISLSGIAGHASVGWALLF
jgi:hypothetical protein